MQQILDQNVPQHEQQEAKSMYLGNPLAGLPIFCSFKGWHQGVDSTQDLV
jgi:hypothetical protein